MEAGYMPKVFYITSWKQLFQCRNRKGEHGTIKKQNNPRIMIVGRKPENDQKKSTKKNSREKKRHRVRSIVKNDGMESIFRKTGLKKFVGFNGRSR